MHKSRDRRESSSSSSGSDSDSGSSSSGSSSRSSSSDSSSRSSRSSSSSSSSSASSRGNRRRDHVPRRGGRDSSPGARKQRSPTPPPTKSSKIHIGHLTRNVNKDHIMEIFSTYGQVRMVSMSADRVHPYLNRGFCYVEFEKPEDAEKACKYMSGGQIDGQEITASIVLAPLKPRYPSRPSPPRRIPDRGGRYIPDRRYSPRRRSPPRRRTPPRSDRRSPRRSRSPRDSTRRRRGGSVSSRDSSR